MKLVQAAKSAKVLVVDVGGTNIKMLATGQKEPRKMPSGPTMTAGKMVRVVKECVKDWTFDHVSLGYPGPIINGHPLREPHNLGGGWMKIDFSKAFGYPVKVINDAAMLRGLERLGKKKWRRYVAKVTAKLKDALGADYVVLGGGNSKKLKVLPDGARLGSNENAFLGGFRMWEK